MPSLLPSFVLHYTIMESMRRTIVIVLVTLGTALFSRASAHEWQVRDGLLVLLHSDPDDSPVVGQPAQLYFYFKEHPTHPFDVRECLCRVKISGNAATVYDGPLHPVPQGEFGANVLAADVVFPEKGRYTAVLTAIPGERGYEPFVLRYGIQVTRTSRAESVWGSPHSLHIAEAIFVALAGVILFFYERLFARSG